MTHNATAYTYARTLDDKAPRLAGWLCTCGARQHGLPTARAATKAAREHAASPALFAGATT